MRMRIHARIGLILRLASVCIVGSVSLNQLAVGQEIKSEPAATTNTAEPPLLPSGLDEILLVQANAMPGGGDVPFTDFNQPAPSQYNYSTGSATPLFESPTFAHVQSGVPEERPGAFRNTQYRWYGFVRLDGIYDFQPIAGTDSFLPINIPIPQGEGDNFGFTPRYTRLGFDTTTDLDFSDVDVNTRIELDFFNGNNNPGAFGSYPFRLRFAWIEMGKLLVGQAASVFMDYDVFPNVLDYQGPPGMILMRQPLARMKFPVFDDYTTISTGLEYPFSDMQWDDGAGGFTTSSPGVITDAALDRNIQDMPDLTSNIRRDGDFGHVQLAGIARRLAFQQAGGPEFDETGYGVNLTGTWHPLAWLTGCSAKTTKCPQPWQKSRFLYQYAVGTGINRYFQDPNGFGLDAVFTPGTGLETIDSNGWFVAYEHWWGDRWASVFSYSEMNVDVPGVLPATTYEEGQYGTANLIFLPFERIGVGIEFLYGQRQNEDGATAQAYRIQTAFQYKF